MNKIKIRKNYHLGKFTTFKIGGPAEYFCMPVNLDEIIQALNFARQKGIDRFIMGGGANLLIADSGYRGLIISVKKLDKAVFRGCNIDAEAGISIDNINKKIMKKSLTGMEFSGGLPGSLGGAIYMNAKAYGGDFAGVVEYVDAVNENLECERLTGDQLEFSYKASVFMKRKELFIYKAGLALNKGNKKEIKNKYKNNADDRKNKGQFHYPSAGCIFKNNYDIGIPTGKIIEELGLKGTRIGNAEVYEKHGNFIINKGDAKASDVLQLIEKIEKSVYEKKGIKLDREVRLLGF